MKLPTLRDRREDIPYLTAAFVRETSERLQKPVLGLTPGAERVLAAGQWEGNVRELRNVIERACILVDGDLITERELAVSMPDVAASPAPAERAYAPALPAVADKDLLATVEREHIQRALVRAGGNKKAAAKMLGLSRRALVSPPRAARSVRDHHAPPRRDLDSERFVSQGFSTDRRGA